LTKKKIGGCLSAGNLSSSSGVDTGRSLSHPICKIVSQQRKNFNPSENIIYCFDLMQKQNNIEERLKALEEQVANLEAKIIVIPNPVIS